MVEELEQETQQDPIPPLPKGYKMAKSNGTVPPLPAGYSLKKKGSGNSLLQSNGEDGVKNNPFAIGGQYNSQKPDFEKLDLSNTKHDAAIAEQIKNTPLRKIPLTPILDNTYRQKPITEIDIKEGLERTKQHKIDMETAIDNTTLKVLKNKGIVAGKGSPLYEAERKKIEEKTKPTMIGGIVINGAEATFHKDKDGNIGLDRNLGFFEGMRKSFNDAIDAEDEANAFSNMTTEQRVEYANKQMQGNPNPEYMEERNSGVGSLIGGAGTYIIEAAAAGTLASAAVIAAPETGGTSLAGLAPALTVLFTAPDMIKQGAKDEIMTRYMQLKQENPNADERELMRIAESGDISGGLLGAANALAYTTSLKLPLLDGSKNVLKKYLNGVASSAVHLGGITAGSKAAQLAERKIEGYHVGTDDAIKQTTHTFVEGATAGAVLKGLMSGANILPKAVKSAMKWVITKQVPVSEVATVLKANVDAGRIPSEVAEQTMADIDGYKKALDKTADGLKPETQASVAGLIQAKDNLIAEMATKDETQREPYQQKIDALNKQIEKITKSNDPFKYEVDEVTGNKIAEPPKEELPDLSVPIEGTDKKGVPIGEDVPVETKPTDVKNEKVEASTGLGRGEASDVVSKVDESTDKQRKRTIVNHLLDSEGDVDGAFEKAGYVNHNGIWVAPEALEYAKKVSPEAWQHMKDKGIKFLEGGDDSRGLQKGIAYGDKTIRGIGINERVGEFHSGHDHTVLHETAHHVWQEELTPEQKKVFTDDNPVSNYAKSVKEGNEKTMGKYDEEDFAELYAKNKGDIDKAIAEKKSQSLSSNTPSKAQPKAETPTQEASTGLSRGDVDLSKTKVVDEKGEPLTVYHSTLEKFDDFNEGVTYFAEDKEYSKYAAKLMNKRGVSYKDIKDEEVITIPVKLNAERIYELPKGVEMNGNYIKHLLQKDPDFTKKYDAVKGIDLYSDNKVVYAVFDKKNIVKAPSLSPNIEPKGEGGLRRGDEKVENNEVSKKYFSEEAFKKAKEQEDNEEGVLVMMPIDDFLAVNPIHKEGEKTKLVADLAESGTKYNEIPFLTYTHTPNGTAIVQGHEGRHRAAELKKRGETVMPVLMKNVYQNENMGRDYVTKKSLADPNAFNEETSGKFPEKLHGASDGRKNTVPFPITREGKSKFGNSDENGAVKEMPSTAAPAKDPSLSPNIEPKPTDVVGSEKTSENKPILNEGEAKTEIPIAKEEGSITEVKSGEVISETKAGEKEPPKPPKEPIEETGGKERLNDKGILNHLVSAENVPEASKKGFEEKGLKYNTSSQKEAESVAKSVIDKYGVEDAVLLAEAQKFDGDVNSLIYAETLNRLAKSEAEAKTQEEKIEFAKKFAEVGIKYDEAGRKGGRFSSAINYFYKKSPLGVQMIENAKRKEAFEEWSKPKDKSWKEFFDEMMKEPEFEKEVSAKVKEEMKKERAEARQARIKKVDEFFDKAKKEFEGGATYSTIIPPKIITAAIDGMKLAYHGGEKVVKLVQDAIDYISEKLGHDTWDKEKFRKEWEEKLKDKQERKPLTDEELKTKILDRFRKKLKGLSDKEKEEVIRKSFHKIVESGGLDYADFKKIIADITGRGELTVEEAARLKELVKETNAVDEAAEKTRTVRTPESRKEYFAALTKAAKASKELNEILYNRPNIIKRLTSIMQLNTLGIPALVNNPIYNIVNQVGLRLPIGIVKTIMDRSIQKIGRLADKEIARETDIASLQVQKEFFNKLGLGLKESGEQFFTGLNRADYTAKEIQGQQIRPATAIRDLWKFFKGEKNLTTEQQIDKTLQATVGIPAEIVARTLNLGDKPQRFAAEGAQAAAFAKALGLKDIDYDLFIDFPREEAYRAYKAKGLSDADAAKKADYIKDTIIKEGQRSTFQQDNMLTDVINRAFGGEQSGVGSLAKAIAISPYIKIPSNAYWSYYNLINPEVAFLQSMIYGAKAYAKKTGKYTRFLGDKYNTSAAKDLNEAKYWFAHGAVGMATRAVVVAMVGAGIVRPSNNQDDTKKEREGEQNYEQQGTINVSKLWAAVHGRNPDDVKNGLLVGNRWFGHFGTMSDAVARKEEEMTPEQREQQKYFWETTFGGMEIDALKDLNQGVFGNTSSLLTAIERKDFQNYGVNLINMFTNIVQPAALAQMERAAMPYYTKQKADTFLGELNNTMLSRSKLYRDLTNQYPPSKIGIWGDKVEKKDNLGMRLFGISRANPDNFAQPIYEDYKRTNNTKFFPPAVMPVIEDNGKRISLPTKDAARLEELVGQQRKNLISPYVNDMATFEGSKETYSKLKDDDAKLDKLRIIYEEGYNNGKALFLKEHPEYIIPEKTKEQKREDKKDSRSNKIFRKALKNKTANY